MKTKLVPLLKYSTLGLSTVLGVNIATASSDYGPAIWNPPCNANYYTSGYGHKFHVCHDMEGYYQSTVSLFNGCGYTSASVHYLTNAKTDYSRDAAPGELTQMISESNPAAVSWRSGRIDVVARGGNNNIYHKYYISGSGWLPNGYWENLGGTAVGAPAICSWGSGRLDVFVRGTDNGLYHNYYSNGAWQRNSNWENLGGTLTSAPAAVSWGSGRIDVVVRGGGNNIYHKYYISGSGWLPSGSFENIGG
ncbi:MAG: hypothetical protein ACR2H1_10610, partial [Limisphaerales bacterium]